MIHKLCNTLVFIQNFESFGIFLIKQKYEYLIIGRVLPGLVGGGGQKVYIDVSAMGFSI